jgi:hypothetical protein
MRVVLITAFAHAADAIRVQIRMSYEECSKEIEKISNPRNMKRMEASLSLA